MSLDYRIEAIQIWPGEKTPSWRRQRSKFKTIWTRVISHLGAEIRQLGGRNVVLRLEVSDKDIRQDGLLRADARPREPGVVVQFVAGRLKGAPTLFYRCDRFPFWQDNVSAIARGLEALRLVDRYGVTPTGEQYAGFKALPSTTSPTLSTTDAANPWMGCTKVSAGCDNCYMFTEQRRYGNDPEVVRRSKTKFADPLKWTEPKVIFTCSWSDWFHKDADPWRDEAWDIIRRTPQHTYQILTKRPGRIKRHLPADWGDGYPNVWLGTSVESHEFANRIRPLVEAPAAIHFLSCEPLLGPLSLRWGLWHDWPPRPASVDHLDGLRMLDWVIVGGESGPNARPMDIEWARELQRQCAEAGVAFFLKQLGGFPDKRGHDKALLDGKRYTEMPMVSA